MKPMRVLQVTDNMNRGGQETFIMNVYRNIERTKVQFDFLISEKDKCDYEDEIIFLGGQVYRTTTKSSGFYKFVQTTNRLLKTIGTGYEVVHIHTSAQISVIAWLFTNIRKIPIKIVHSHNSINDSDAKGKIRVLLSWIISRHFTYRFACSEVAGDWLFGSREKDKKGVCIIKNGIDAQSFIFNGQSRQKVRHELNIADNFVIGHIGRFNKQKNHVFLIDIFHELYKLHPDARLILVGVGELENEIREKVWRLNLKDAVLFLGLRTDIKDILSAMDVFLVPSLYEGLPVVGIEAQAAGVRSIIADTVTKELDITGLIDFISLDTAPKIWAEKLLAYQDGYIRKNTFEAISNAGYNIRTTVKELEEKYCLGLF